MTWLQLMGKFSALEDPEDREDGLALARQFADCAAEYVRAVVRMETGIPLLRLTEEPESYRTQAEELDRRRTSCHNALIDAVTILNRMAVSCGFGPFFEGDPGDRWEVAEFAGRFVKEIYDSRSGGLHSPRGGAG